MKNAGSRQGQSSGRPIAAGVGDERHGDNQRRDDEAELEQAERLVLRVRERREDGVKQWRGDRQRPDDEDGDAEDAVADRALSEASRSQDPPVGQEQDCADELQEMAAAPKQGLARDHQLAPPGEQRSGDRECDQRKTIDEARDRHGERQRRGDPPARQVEKQARHRGENAERQHEQSEVIGRMADEGDIVGQLRPGRLEEGGREQAGEGDQRDALPDPAERRRAQVLDARRLAGGAKGRDRDQKREYCEEPDHQRKDDVDDEALVEEIDRPERRFLHPRDARKRQQEGEHAGCRQRPDREPRPVAKLAPQGVRDAGCGKSDNCGG